MKKVAIITGGAGGIGFQCAKQYRDCHVVLAGRKEDGLKDAVAKLKSDGYEASYVVTDISNKDSVQGMYAHGKSKGDIFYVVNSAGVSGAGAPLEIVYDVDVEGARLVTEGAYEHLASGGVLVLIASMMHKIIELKPEERGTYLQGGEKGKEIFLKTTNDPNTGYALAKRINVELVKEKADAFGEKGLRIVAVSPGIILTPMAKEAMEKYPEKMKVLEQATPVGRMGEPEDVAKAVAFLCSEDASFITGSILHVDGGLHPRKLG
ncbi:MAG: SDR family oxidoreductase [Tissierellia bacterium]|nr:SDR family oxidoreductase [Tissierellia bacterium]